MGWWDDFWGTVTDLRHDTAKVTPLPGADTVVPDLEGAGGAVSALNDTLSFTKAVWLNISDFRMWRSLGWLLLGLLLMIVGFVMWNRKAVASVRSAVPL